MRLKHQPTEQLKQTPHIVAFLDFLGASEKMRDPAKNDKFLQDICTVYNFAKHILKETEKNRKNKLEIKIFSDNILVAKKIEDSNAHHSVFDAYIDVEQFSLILYMNAMLTGNFMRGKISIGQLYVDDTLVYGQALIDAHDGEAKIANYPRIIVDKEILVRSGKNICDTFHPHDEEKIILRDMDGELYLSPFWGTPKIAEDKRKQEESLLYSVGTAIVNEYKEIFAKDRKAIFPKYHWLANQFNVYCHVNNYPFLINLDKLTLGVKHE